MDNGQESGFKDTILSEIGEIPISNTQKYRVLIVLDCDTQQPRLSAQRWWRKDADKPWKAGKGFKLDNTESQLLSNLISVGGEKLESYGR